MIGSGVFAVNRAGAERIGTFPDVINDDGYVRRMFAPEERFTSPGEFTISAPHTLGALVRRRARIANGNVELDGHLDDADEARTGLHDVVDLVRSSAVSPVDAAAFVVVTGCARVLGRWRRLRGRGRHWSTDTTSRQHVRMIHRRPGHPGPTAGDAHSIDSHPAAGPTAAGSAPGQPADRQAAEAAAPGVIRLPRADGSQ